MDPHWQSLKVPVTEDFSLDAGTWRGIGEKDAERIVEPPTVPLIDQLVAHVERSPDSVLRQSDNASGAALASLTVRFGSYFAILADASKPPWRTSQGLVQAAITDSEMSRINIEASHALSTLLGIYQVDPNRYLSLLRRAIIHLPLPIKSARRRCDDPRCL